MDSTPEPGHRLSSASRRGEPTGRILVADDRTEQRDALVRYLTDRRYAIAAVTSGDAALLELSANRYEVLVSELDLAGLDGLALVRAARQRRPELGVVVTTASSSVDGALAALRLGVLDYLRKPLRPVDVERRLRRLLELRSLAGDHVRLGCALARLDRRLDDTLMVAGSAAMRSVREWTERAARSRATVLITGETGSGKEVVAHAIHRLSADAAQPFLAINLAAVPHDMAESELFGHERGAFTGACRRREGLLRAAGGGTVFLDEIGELRPLVQAKLLRALEQREARPVGSDRACPLAARIIAATNRELGQMVAAGRFREDLFYRLNVLQLPLPPLRSRREDIPYLSRELVERHARRSGVPPPAIAAAAMRALVGRRWRGNVRELSNVLERAILLAEDGRIEPWHLPADEAEESAPVVAARLDEAVVGFERSHIAWVLRLHRGNRERAARDLGVSRATLYRRLVKLGLRADGDERLSLP